MKFATALLCAGAVSASVSDNQEMLFEIMNLQTSTEPCPPPLEITDEELSFQLGQFSRNFEMSAWNNAMDIAAGLAKAGKTPRFAVTTKELYDKSFSFTKVRNYDYAVENMNEL